MQKTGTLRKQGGGVKHAWPKIGKRKVASAGKTYRYWYIDGGVIDGKRKILSFRTEEEARLEADRMRIARNKIGGDALRLRDRDKQDAVRALEVLARRATLEAAAVFFVKHTPTGDGNKLLSDVFTEYVAAKITSNKRPDTIADIKTKIGRLVRDHEGMKIGDLTFQQIESWLVKMGLTSASRQSYLRVVKVFCGYCVRRGYMWENPADRIERPHVDHVAPEVMTVGDVQKIMAACEKERPDMVPYFALGFFAGLRPAEIQGLDWRDIDFSDRVIKVVPTVAKTRRQRFVDLSENLGAWLSPYQRNEGLIYYSRKDFEWVRTSAGVKWPHDVMRHSFGSYHLGAHGDIKSTCLQMGHLNPDMLFSHYRGLVKKDDAERFWTIRPAMESNVLHIVKAG